MKVLSLLFAFALSAFADPVKVADTGVTFTPPPGFKPVPQEIIDVKWPSKRAPKFVVGNEGATTSVAYDLKDHDIPQDKLEEASGAFAELFPKMIPGLVWKKKEIIEHSGQKWVFFEMTSTAVDTDIHNIMLFTGFKGKMLIFNFNSTKEEFPKYEKELRESLKSIKLP